MRNHKRKNFWEKYQLTELNKSEWEALCDRCGKCCLIKLKDKENSEVHYTNLSCKEFDVEKCKCKNYKKRKTLVEDCIVLSPKTIAESHKWMPPTCAYRLLYEGKKLYDWHPLISKNLNSVHLNDTSIKNKTIPETEVPQERWQYFTTNIFAGN